MSKLTENDIDNIFQRGSDKYDFEYNEKSWEQMEGLLNNDKTQKNRLFLWRILSFLFVIGIPLVLLLINNRDSSHSIDSPVINKELQNKVSNEINNTKRNESNIDSTEVSTNSIDADNGLQSQSIAEKSITKTTVLRKGNSINASTANRILNRELDYNSTLNKANNTPNEENNTKSFVDNNMIYQPNKSIIKNTTLDNGINEDKNSIANNANLYISFLPVSLMQVSPTNKNKIGLTEKMVLDHLGTDAKQSNNQFLIAVSLSSESSIVNPSEYSKLNWKLGTQLSYRFRNHFNISIGANYIKKKYSANKGSYIPPVGFWTRKIIPQMAIGRCDVLELPFEVGFFLKDYQESGFYTNLGISSYIMLKENYSYQYIETDLDLIKNWHTKQAHEYWFGIGTFSIGYQFYSQSNSITQIAPYIHVPLTGVGHGQVKLWSVGLNFKLNFIMNK